MATHEIKRCSRCERWLPLSVDDWYRYPSGKWESWCRECLNAYKRDREERARREAGIGPRPKGSRARLLASGRKSDARRSKDPRRQAWKAAFRASPRGALLEKAWRFRARARHHAGTAVGERLLAMAARMEIEANTLPGPVAEAS